MKVAFVGAVLIWVMIGSAPRLLPVGDVFNWSKSKKTLKIVHNFIFKVKHCVKKYCQDIIFVPLSTSRLAVLDKQDNVWLF